MSAQPPHSPSTSGGPSTQYARAETDGQLEQDDDWREETGELPRRPRRRLLSPIPLALLGVLLIAGGFIGGVLVEKGEGSSSSSSTGAAASGLAARFRALRGGATGSPAGGSAAGGSAAGGAGFARPTAGTVAYVAGSTLYVTNAEGNTVKVQTSPGTAVSKTVKATLNSVHPGETVTVTGASGSAGAVSAEAISVGSGAGGGLASLFAGGGAGGGGSTTRGAGGSASGAATGGQALFGNGG